MNFNTIKYYYENGLWNINMVKDAVVKGVITTDEFKEITNVSEYSQFSLEESKIYKIDSIKDSCDKEIIFGTNVKIGDKELHFTFDQYDQINLLTMVLESKEDPSKTFSYHSTDEELNRYYSGEEITLIYNELLKNKNYQLEYCRCLVAYINSLTDIDTISNIEYGISIPEEFQTDELKKYI